MELDSVVIVCLAVLQIHRDPVPPTVCPQAPAIPATLTPRLDPVRLIRLTRSQVRMRRVCSPLTRCRQATAVS